jgi:multiple sugar transport system substrate-binding protein
MDQTAHDNRPTLTRRQALAMFGGTGVALGLLGCDVETSSNAPSPGAKAAAQIAFPDPKVKLPTGDVTFRWIDSGDLKSLFEKPVLDSFTKKHPNIKTQYDGTGWDRVDQVVPLGIRNGTAPDVFAMPTTVPTETAVEEGWIRPIDDLVPDFEAWKKNFPETAFIPGVHVFDGRIYSFSLSSNRRLQQMLFYDTEYLKAAGYGNPDTDIRTWDDLRTAAKKLTEAGKGKYYGLMTSGDTLDGMVAGLAISAGWRSIIDNTYRGFDFRAGRYIYNDPTVLEAIDLLRAIESDKSFFPGYLSLSEVDARGRMPNRVAGMIFDGPWDIPKWPEINPNWDFDLTKVPSPDGKDYTMAFEESGSNLNYVYAKSAHPEVAAELFSYMGSVEGQVNLVVLSKGNLVSMIDQANQKADISELLDPLAKKATDLAKSMMRMGPMVQVRNPEAAKVGLKVKSVKPGFKEVIQGIFAGKIDDPKKALTELNDKLEANLDKAVAQAKGKGVKASRDDWAFPNWDPAKEYTKAEYDAL